MMRKRRGSSAPDKRAGKNETGMKSNKINFSDIPELSDNQLSSMRRIGRPTMGDEPRKLVPIRIDGKGLGPSPIRLNNWNVAKRWNE